MTAEPALEPTLGQEDEEYEELNEGEESDEYDVEGDEEAEGDDYELQEDEEDGEVGPENLTAHLLGKQNGSVEEEEDEDEDEEYQEDEALEVPSSAVSVGSKRGVDELDEEDASGDEDDDDGEGQAAPKKARV